MAEALLVSAYGMATQLALRATWLEENELDVCGRMTRTYILQLSREKIDFLRRIVSSVCVLDYASTRLRCQTFWENSRSASTERSLTLCGKWVVYNHRSFSGHWPKDGCFVGIAPNQNWDVHLFPVRKDLCRLFGNKPTIYDASKFRRVFLPSVQDLIHWNLNTSQRKSN
jgi:hypothetical protein